MQNQNLQSRLNRREALAALAAVSFNAARAEGAPPATTQSSTPWRGVHVMLGGDADCQSLLGQVQPLADAGINTLVVEVNYNFAYQKHAELRGADVPITGKSAKELARRCHASHVRLIPEFNCLGHQSWKANTLPLLMRYPEFDETPGKFERNEGIYCRSWCPREPKVKEVVHSLFDELIEAFEADAFHIGMDEVMLICSQFCPRCRGKDPAETFAAEVTAHHHYLTKQHKAEVLMWGDRLLDGKATGLGEWEASVVGTAGAIDHVPKDIILCDWHYGQRDGYPSIPLFLEKGFRVWPASWKDEKAADALARYSLTFKNERMLGHLSTVWNVVPIDRTATFPPLKVAMERMK